MSSQSISQSVSYQNEDKEDRKNKWILLRIIGNFGSQGNALLVPLLIFYMTKSAAAAGLALAMEWAPKIIIYLTGGMVLDFFGKKKVHGYLELIRGLAWIGFLASATGFLKNFEWVAVCAALYQCSNAISNIMFETIVAKEWKKEEHAQGYARLLKADQAGCFLMLGLSVILHAFLSEHGTIMGLALLGLLVQGQLTFQTFKFHGLRWKWTGLRCVKETVHAIEVEPKKKESMSFWDGMAKGLVHFKQQIQWSCNSYLLGLAINHLMVRLPLTLAFAMMPLVLAEHATLANNVVGWFSWILLMKAGISWGLIALVQHFIWKWKCEKYLFFIGLSLSLTGGVMLENHKISEWILWSALTILNAAGLLMTPFARTLRQKIITEEIPSKHQSGVSGVMISVEALVYIAVTILMSLCGGSMQKTIQYCCYGACIGSVGLMCVLWWYAKHQKSKES